MNQLIYNYTIMKVFKQQLQDDTKKNMILEPLSCILKISLLQFKPDNTKISVNENSLSFNEPHLTQGLFRSFYGECREDLHNLYNPIIQCLEWYPYEEDIFRFFYEQCIQGLKKLINVYNKNTTIHHTLIHYIDILETNKKEKLSKLENPIIETLQDMWSEKELELIYHLYNLILSDEKNTGIYLQSLEDILEKKEKQLYTYIKSISTSY